MTYLAAFNIIGVKGLFHSDWLGASPSAPPIGPQLVAGETVKFGNIPLYYQCELGADLTRKVT